MSESEYTTPQRLKDFRVMNGYTQEQAAKMTGLSPAAISHFETGKRTPSAANLRKLAIGYNISVDFILGTREFERKEFIDGEYVDIVFEGSPHCGSCYFVEVENSKGESVCFGEWNLRPDGYWILRIPNPRKPPTTYAEVDIPQHIFESVNGLGVIPSKPVCENCGGTGYVMFSVDRVEQECCRKPLPSGECCGQPTPRYVKAESRPCGLCAEIDKVLKVREFVDWDQAPDWARFWAMSSGGKADWFKSKPVIDTKMRQWLYGGDWSTAPDFGFIGDWRKSLRARPPKLTWSKALP